MNWPRYISGVAQSITPSGSQPNECRPRRYVCIPRNLLQPLTTIRPPKDNNTCGPCNTSSNQVPLSSILCIPDLHPSYLIQPRIHLRNQSQCGSAAVVSLVYRDGIASRVYRASVSIGHVDVRDREIGRWRWDENLTSCEKRTFWWIGRSDGDVSEEWGGAVRGWGDCLDGQGAGELM
jgi:hypothetical protein